MDEGLSRAVLKVFVELHKAGLIYKDKRLVNWDPKFQTAISDLEVVQIEKKGSFKWTRGDKDETGAAIPLDNDKLGKVLDREPAGHMYYFNYPLDGAKYDPDNAETFLTVATTRPETMLGDTAVAVHPEHPEYGDMDRPHVDPAAHGTQDSDHRRRLRRPREGHRRRQDHARARLQRLRGRPAARGRTRRSDQHFRRVRKAERERAGETYRGMDRFEARKQVVADLDALASRRKDRAERPYGAARRPFAASPSSRG